MAEQTAIVISPAGQLLERPAAEADELAANGYVPASPKQIDDYRLEQKFGTGTEAAKAFGEHALGAATFGASDWAERGLGISTPEAMAAREKYNPLASGLGTAVGIAAPLLATGGTSLLGEGAAGAAEAAAELAPTSLLSKAGQAVSRAVEGKVTGGVAKSAGQQILARAAGVGAGSAIEGLGYGAGQAVHESALGDPNYTAQSAMMTIGLGGVLGGFIGAGGGALGGLIKQASGGEIGAKLADWAEGFEAERNAKAAGAIQNDLKRAGKQLGEEGLKKVSLEMRDLGLVGALSTPPSTLEKAGAMLAETGGKMGDLLNSADAKLTSETAPKIADLITKARTDILEPLAANPLEKGAASSLGNVLQGYEEKFADGMTLRDLHQMRRQVSDKLYGLRGSMDPDATVIKKSLHEFRSLISDELSTGIDRVGANSAEWKTLNRTYQVASMAEKWAQAGVDRLRGNNLISPTEFLGSLAGGIHAGPLGAAVMGVGTAAVRRHAAGVMGAGARMLRGYLEDGGAETVANKMGDMVMAERQAGRIGATVAGATSAPETVAALSQLERNNQAVTNKIDSMAESLVRVGQVGRNEAMAGIAKVAGKASEELHGERFAQLNGLASDPSQMHAALEQQNAHLQEHAPQTAQAMNIATSRAVGFLASKLPSQTQPGPLAPKQGVSKGEIAKFNRYYDAVNDPAVILRQAADGTLTPEAVEAVRTVYPELYQKISGAVIDKVASHAKDMPYQTKQMISLLMGQDMDGSQKTILANQAIYQGPTAKQQGGMPKIHLGGVAKMTSPQNFLTHMQATANRR